jgi:hypothetical protein
MLARFSSWLQRVRGQRIQEQTPAPQRATPGHHEHVHQHFDGVAHSHEHDDQPHAHGDFDHDHPHEDPPAA